MARKQNSISRTFVWIILGLLFVGLAGFGATNFSGSVQSIGSVGDKEIPVTRYVRALQDEMGALSAQTGQAVTFQQAQSLGLDRQVLGQLITTRALDHEAAEMGLSIGDENLRKQLLTIDAFRGADGQFDREAYRFALRNAGMSEAGFEQQMREDTARTLLQAAILAGNALPDTYVDTMIGYLAERRDFTWARVGTTMLDEDIAEPDEAALKAFYEAEIAEYTRPEIRAITYAWLTPVKLVDTIEVPEDRLRELYAAREAEFNRPERRLVERLVFANEAEASEAKAQIEVSGTSFNALVEERGLSLSDIDLGDVTRAELGEAGDAVFAAEPGVVLGPLPSDLGPALYRVNAVLAAQETSFDEARDTLAEDEAMARAQRVIETQAEGINDLLAGGATIEELAGETEMEVGRIDWHRDMDEGIAAYEEFRALAGTVTPEDFPEVVSLEDGGIFALRLDEIRPPEPLPLDEIRDRVRADWKAAETLRRLESRAQELADRIGEGRLPASLGLQPVAEQARTRREFIEGLPEAALERVFAMAPGDVAVITGQDAAYILRLDSVLDPDEDDPDVAAIRRTIADRAANGVSQDLFQAFANDIQARAGIKLDQQALNAVHASFP